MIKRSTLSSISPFYLFLVLLLSGATISEAQFKTADKFYRKRQYYDAVEEYERAFKEISRSSKKVKNEVAAYYRYAESCRYTYQFQKAEGAYQKVIESGEKERFATVDFYYAYTLKHNAKYDEAAKEFQEYLKLESKTEMDERLHHLAAQELLACEESKRLVANPDDRITIEPLKEVNTRYSDFGPHEVDGALYYSSLKFERNPRNQHGDDSPERHLIGKIMYAKDQGRRRGIPITALNKKYINAGNTAISLDGQRLYLTQCEAVSDQEIMCHIYVSEKQGEHRWSKPVKLPKNVNINTATCTHPNIGYDSIAMKEYLFFVSDREGGFGKLDLWRSEIISAKDNKYGDPVNLGSMINTEDDEATPFFHTPTQTLYFSSKWHLGLGGYDIFTSKPEPNGWTAVENAGVPINSAANDVYFNLSPVDTIGYFASNRPGSKVLTGESCCNDIYALTLPKYVPVTETDTLITSVEPEPNPEPDPEPVVEPDPEPVIDPNPEPQPDPEPVVEPNPEPVIEPNPEPQPDPNPEPETDYLDELNKMLPLSLYFHNDEPDPDVETVTSTKTYESAYNAYVQMKNKYKNKYKGEDAIQNDIVRFFEQDVEGEYERMNTFFETVLMVLETGESLEISLKGFTSPRAESDYNYALAQRRISSVRKQMAVYKDGALQKYLNEGKLIIREVPLGESQSPNGIADDLDDEDSIYSVEASKERKVQILVVTRQPSR